MAFKATDFRPRHHFDIGKSLDPIDQVARHRGAEIGCPDQHPDLGGLACKINRSLAGGIASSNERDLLIRA